MGGEIHHASQELSAIQLAGGLPARSHEAPGNVYRDPRRPRPMETNLCDLTGNLGKSSYWIETDGSGPNIIGKYMDLRRC